MLNFNFYNPTRIIFGKDTVAQLSKLVPAGARVLVLYGGQSAVKNGTMAEVKAALASHAFVKEFSGIEPNPRYETLMKAVALVKEEKIDFLLAVGGGSVIDGTKFVAAAAVYEGEPWDFVRDRGRTVKGAVPFGSVLTLPATGSEMNNGSVVTRESIHEKKAFMSEHTFPVFSILDPTKTYTLPVKQVANGVVDTFVHIVEQYLTYPVDGKVQDYFAEGLLKTLIEIAPTVMSQTDDYDSRANLMWTATLGLNGLIGAGVPQDWTTHMIGHEITALYEIDHARTLAIVLPSLLKVKREAKGAKLLQYAKRVWGISEGSDAQCINAAIARTADFFEGLGIPTRLSAYGLGQKDVDAIVGQLKAHNWVKLGERQDITPEVAQVILEGAL